MNIRTLKTIGSWVVAIVISVIFVSLFLKMLQFGLHLLFELAFIIIILIFALPIFVIVRKKLFK